ncbi:hypothetical protein [Leucobacter sp. USHLN153]|uniref:hypothetical protein n=1 Tax=Leucobacter sp. USHLN153 TaxID=3081268 RepID=UPI003015DE10
MSPRTRAILGVTIMSAVLVLYFVLAGIRAVALLSSGEAVAIVMGVAMLVLPIIGFWALVRELLFGSRATQLADRLESEGQLPDEPVATHPSGRPDRADADAAFPRYRDEVEADPESWRAWMRLGIVYDAAGDRKRARGAIRQAIALERQDLRR